MGALATTVALSSTGLAQELGKEVVDAAKREGKVGEPSQMIELAPVPRAEGVSDTRA